MSYLIDTNRLVRLTQKTHPHRTDARRALIALRSRGEELCLVPQNLIESWAVATRPAASNGLGLGVDEAARETKKLKRLFKLLPDTPASFAEWERPVVRHRVMGRQVHDARQAAAAVAHNVAHVLTFNTDDFERFTEITAVNPVDLK